MYLIRLIIVTALLLEAVFPSLAQQGKMLGEIKSHTKGMALWWAGHNSWIIKSGDVVIATDLWLENGYRFAPAPITAEELAGVIDVSFVTHAHDDHFNKSTTSILLEKSKWIFVMQGL